MFKQKGKSILYSALLSLFIFRACSDIDNTGTNTVNANNGFISAEVIDDINASTMLSVIKSQINPSATNAFAYKAVKIVYKTEDMYGAEVNASGLLVIPSATAQYQAYRVANGQTPFSVSMICDNHGTIFTDIEAPSNVETTNGLPEYTQAVLMTGYAGFASVMPDYLGYGTSNSSAHPYMLKEPSAQNSLDMIKASMKYMEDNGVVLNYQLYVSGYSQGGHVAMALAQKIESEVDIVDLKGVAPMAGPHDLEALANIEINASHTMVYPAFLGYLADSYAYKYDDLNLSDIVVESNTTMYHNLFDGSNTNIAIHTGLGLVEDARGGFNHQLADKLFKDSFITDYQNNENSIARQKFIENKSYDNWTPRSKVNLVHCLDDEIIPYSMSQNAFNDLNATGADITLSPIPTVALSQQVDASNPFIHANCATESYGIAVTWFDAIRSGEI